MPKHMYRVHVVFKDLHIAWILRGVSPKAVEERALRRLAPNGSTVLSVTPFEHTTGPSPTIAWLEEETA